MKRRFRQILKKIVQTKKEMGTTMREASFALIEAKYSAGEFQHTVFDAVEQVGPNHASSAVCKCPSGRCAGLTVPSGVHTGPRRGINARVSLSVGASLH